MADKLYVVVRSDLDPGIQAVQGMHSARQYAHEYPEIESQWFNESNHLAVLSIDDETSLTRLTQRANQHGITYSIFREPDLNNEITSVTFEPGIRGRRLCSGLKLALK